MLAPGTRIDDRYEILASLSSGGMGAVYRARRLKLGDEVAIKVMLAGPESTPELRERFLRESKACAQLRHPNIVSILDYDVDAAQQPFMVMELLSGPSLREEIELESPMQVPRVVDVLGPVASALQLAHDRGMTHRDLKPANIVVHRYESGERVYKVIDFGLVSFKATGDETRLTNPNFFLGTLAYSAPEQMSGDPVTAKTDQYALAMIAYEMLTGALPFDKTGTTATVISQRMTAAPQTLSTKQAGLSGDIDRIVMKALEQDPANRWESVTEFVHALREAAGASGVDGGSAQQGLLARYELGPMLGRGRLGSVIYKATHRALGNTVAIRILKRDEHPNFDVVRGRFLVEARTLQVAHPGLLQVRDFGEDEKNVYLVTDFIEGPSLRQALAETGAFPWTHAKPLLSQAMQAVSALHKQGGFISGVNPDMIRLRASEDEGGSIIMSTAGIRSVQDVLATMREQELRGQEASEQELPYVAPEILMGGPPTIKGDIFTIGALAYQMLTAKSAFTAPSLPELMGKMLMSKPAAPNSINTSVPQEVSDAVLRALSGDQQQRFESIEALARSAGL